MADKNDFGFSVPGYQAPQGNAGAEGELPDFSKMSKQEIKAFDAAEGSYKRLLGDKPITRLWLMNHYSAANAAAYKEQKARKKMEKEAAKASPLVKSQQSVPEQYIPPQPLQKNPSERQPEYHRDYSSQKERLPETMQEDGEDFFGHTVYLDRGNTGEARRVSAALMCVAFHRSVEISKIPFRIGRNPKKVDLCISDNQIMSGCHAEITFQEGNYYIRDLDSLNHTYVDDTQISGNTLYRLHSGARIVLGNEEFIFELNG